jgi:hypothetical protein
MNRSIPIIGLCAAFAAASASLAAQAQEQPKAEALCLPPGAKAPVACGTARAGQPMNLVISTTSLPTGPVSLLFSEENTGGRAPRTARANVSAASLNDDGSYSVIVPRELCGDGGNQGQYEIQDLMSSFNQAENRARPIGTVTVAC